MAQLSGEILMDPHLFFDRMLDAIASSLNPEAARGIAAFRVNPGIQARVAALAERANEGQLRPTNATSS